MSNFRDVETTDAPGASAASLGRQIVMVIGIDQYRRWGRLKNAVNDARGVTSLFHELGFEELVPPLLNDAATGVALRKLVVTDLKRKLREDDSLVLFFAGHGYTETTTLQGTPVRVGYIIPVDGDAPGGDAGTWLELESWLKDVARLPPRHILVVLDSCHSGMALELSRTRGASPAPYEQLLARRSRRVITSAQDHQQALDDGPAPDHSLFTGLLIQALHGDIATDDRVAVTGAELAIYLQRRVSEHRPAQTPDFGTLSLDAGGDMVLSLVGRPRRSSLALPPTPRPRTEPRRSPILPLAIAIGLCATAITGTVLVTRGTGDLHTSVDSAADPRGGDGEAGSSTSADAGTTLEAGPVSDRRDATLDASLDAPPDVAAEDAGSKRHGDNPPGPIPLPVYCYRPPTGGFQRGKPRCASSRCGHPDSATENNERYQQLKCEQLCECF